MDLRMATLLLYPVWSLSAPVPCWLEPVSTLARAQDCLK